MQKIAIPIRSISILMALVLVFALSVLRPQAAHAADGKDYVIVIDVSTSMQDIFDEVKQLSKRTIDRATVGDSVTVITFGERATLVDRKQIRGKSDIKNLKESLDGLYPTDYATYINRGLEKGLSELRYLFEKNPERERVLLWLSDDKDNPPDELGDDYITLDKLKEDNTSFDPGREWFAYDAPSLGDEVENRSIEDFVMWARRTTFRVTVKEQGFDLGSFEDGNVQKNIALTFEPKNPGASGFQFFVSANLVDTSDAGNQILAEITPNRITASGSTWKQKFKLAFEAEPGEYSGTILFEPIAGGALEVIPRTIGFKVAIASPEPEPIEPEVLEPRPTGVLADAKEKGIIATEARPRGTTRITKPISFGPLEPGKKDTKMVMLFLSKEADPKSITHDLSLNIPDGITFETRMFGRGTELTAEMTVKVAKDIELPEQFSLEGAYEGSVRFKSDEPGVEVLPIHIPLRLTFDEDNIRWGKKMLPQTGVGQVKARRMSFEELTEELGDKKEEEAQGSISTALKSIFARDEERSIFWPIVGAIVLIIGILLYRLRPAREIFAGELIVIKDPSDSNMKNVNLKRIGSLHNKSVLTLGASATVDIRLGHDSVAAIHSRILARTVDGATVMSIQAVKGNPVRINEIEQSGKTVLSDKDLIGIGEFILLFSNPEAQKEVVARFLDGRIMRGSPVTWDVGAPSFELLRTDLSDVEGTTEEIAIVNFAEIKAIFFLQEGTRPDAGIPADMIDKEVVMEIVFSDGEKIEGAPLKDYSDAAGRFYIVPLEMPNIASILIERAGVNSMTTRKVSGESELGKSAGMLASIRKRRGGGAPAK